MTPMAIWTSKLTQISQVKKAVYTDVEFIHHNPLVKQACLCYCLSIHWLINYPNQEGRATKVFEWALEFSKSRDGEYCSDGETLQQWLEIAKKQN